MVLNQNMPVVEDSWAPAYGANGGGPPPAMWVDLTGRTQVATSIKRGKQYELDAIQSGTYDTTLNNQDGALDPLNTAGPWAGNIMPYQPLRHRVQWYPTVNRLPQTLATGGEGYSAGVIPVAWGTTSQTDTTGGSIVVLGAGVAFEESNAFQFAVPSTSPAYGKPLWFDAGAITPGQTYTFSTYVRNITPGVSTTLYAAIGWQGSISTNPTSWSSGSPVILAGSATAGWTRLTVTGTAPSTVYGAELVISLPAAGQATSCTVQVDGQQFEIGSSASTWVYPGLWTPLFTGFVERWPTQWADGGTRGQVVPTGVDALAFFSQVTLSDALSMELGQYSPRFIYRLDDPQGSTTFSDFTGQCPVLPIGSAKTGAGSVSAGTAITAANTTTGVFTGSTGTVTTLVNQYPGTATSSGGASYLQLDAAGIVGPANPQLFTRVLAFRYTGPTPTSGNTACLWSLQSSIQGLGIELGIDSTGGISFSQQAVDGLGGGSGITPGTVAGDGNWHLVHVVGVPDDIPDEIPGGYSVYLDGVHVGGTAGGGHVPTPISDVYGTNLNRSTRVAANNFQGDMAFIAEWPSSFSPAQISSNYLGWKSCFSGESTDARYARILRYAGYTGTSWLDAGLTRSMGPATDLDGTDALSALQAVCDTESGEHHVRATGTVRFLSRAARYNSFASGLIFGDGPGEIPYEDVQLDFDPTHLANQVTITQNATNANFIANDAVSIAAYFPRILTRTVNNNNVLEIQDQANYLLSRYKNPLTRVSSIKVHMSAYPQAWQLLNALDLVTRVTIRRRPFGAPMTQTDCFVEQIQWDFDDKGEAWLTMQCSPIDPTPYFVLGAWWTTLAAAASSGTNTITVNQSSAYGNPLASQLAVGQQIVVGQGGSVPETMTISAIGATSPGWTTATIQFTANLAHSHTNGFQVGEPLTSGITAPTTWNPVDMFDLTAFSY